MAKEKNNEGIVEAVLFISGRFLSLQDLVMYTGINPITLKETLLALEEKYKQNTGALDLIVKGDLYKMDIRQEYAWLTNKLASGSTEFTKAEQETLAIIAYKQPITQSVIVKIRGNKAYDHIKKLIDVGLVKPKRTGHTYELKLDEAFYNYFSIKTKERMEQQAQEMSGKIEEAKAELASVGVQNEAPVMPAEVDAAEEEAQDKDPKDQQD